MQEFPSGPNLSKTQAEITRLWKECLQANRSRSLDVVNFEFKKQQIANECFMFLNDILPIKNGEFPQLKANTIRVTEDQYYFLQLYAMQETGALSSEYLGDHYLLKTLRDDQGDFTTAFIAGIIPGEDGARYQNLRPKNRSAFTIAPNGQVVARLNKRPVDPNRKKGFSQIQSCTFIDDKVWSLPFGFSKDRRSKLYGLMTHLNDALIKCLLVKDSGTVSRIFEFDSVDEAKKSDLYKKAPEEASHFQRDKFDQFKERIGATDYAGKTNEVLARLRFNPYRTLVTICADSLEARLLAYHFSQELLAEFIRYAKRNNLTVNPNFNIPIIFYVPTYEMGSKPDFLFYTPAMRLRDQAEALSLYNNDVSRTLKLSPDPDADIHLWRRNLESSFPDMGYVINSQEKCGYDFLLGLAEKSSAHFYHYKFSLVHEMFYNGYVRRALRLLGPFKKGDEQNLCNIVLTQLLDQGRFHENDEAIARLIVAEAFDVADFLIERTSSQKQKLRFGWRLLGEYLIAQGNPRHLKYMGLDALLSQAAAKGEWITVKLCVKEYPALNKTLLGTLLFEACRQRRAIEVDFLLKRGADKTISVNGQTPIVCATMLQDWITVAMFAHYPTDHEDHAHYGFALMAALRYEHRGLAKLLLQAGAKPTWRSTIEGYELESTLFHALEHEYEELSEPLNAHENLSDPSIDFFKRRYHLVRDLAYSNDNHVIVARVEKRVGFFAPIGTQESEETLCRFVLEALAVGNVENGLQRLELYTLGKVQCRLSREQICSGLAVISRHFNSGIQEIPAHTLGRVLENLVILLIEYEDSSLFKTLMIASSYMKIPSYSQSDDFISVETLIFKTILLHISNQKIMFVFSLFDDLNTLSRFKIHIAEAFQESIADPSKYDSSFLLKLKLKGYCSPEATLKIIKIILRDGYHERKDGLLLSILYKIKDQDNYQLIFQEVLFQLWANHPIFSDQLVNEYIAIFGSSYIRYLTLKFLSDFIDYSMGSENASDRRLGVQLSYSRIMPRLASKQLQQYQTILSKLQDYFLRKDLLPAGDVTFEVYEAMLGEFRQLNDTSKGQKFFSQYSTELSFNRKMYEYLCTVEQRLNEHDLNIAHSPDASRYILPTEFELDPLDFE